MKLGRNFTNTFVLDKLSKEDQNKVLSGEYDLFSMNALGLIKFKKDISSQIKLAKEFDLDHIELDGDVPNPYPDFSKEERKRVREEARKEGISLSLHLSYSNAGSSVCSLQELDRRKAVELQKVYIDFASDIGARYLVMHPGSAPFYMISEIYLERLEKALVKTLVELGNYAQERNLLLHLENNVAFDNIFVEPEKCIEAVEEARRQGAEIYFNFDIGHWFTRADCGKDVPDEPERVMEKIPKELVKELHLNDYVPKKITFHPPLHLETGPLKKENLKRYFEIVKKLEPELIVLETAYKYLDQVKDRKKILEEETAYIKELMRNAQL
ncbi:sugar phosphate isomerase/epimerase [bacterium]|nr:sugar phosphate isomerase/epimerase [bacterium]